MPERTGYAPEDRVEESSPASLLGEKGRPLDSTPESPLTLLSDIGSEGMTPMTMWSLSEFRVLLNDPTASHDDVARNCHCGWQTRSIQFARSCTAGIAVSTRRA